MWIYRHPLFHRDAPDLLPQLKRKTNPAANLPSVSGYHIKRTSIANITGEEKVSTTPATKVSAPSESGNGSKKANKSRRSSNRSSSKQQAQQRLQQSRQKEELAGMYSTYNSDVMLEEQGPSEGFIYPSTRLKRHRGEEAPSPPLSTQEGYFSGWSGPLSLFSSSPSTTSTPTMPSPQPPTLASSLYYWISSSSKEPPSSSSSSPSSSSPFSVDASTVLFLSQFLEERYGASSPNPNAPSLPSYLPELITFCVTCADLAVHCASSSTSKLTVLSSLVFDLLSRRKDLREELSDYRMALWGAATDTPSPSSSRSSSSSSSSPFLSSSSKYRLSPSLGTEDDVDSEEDPSDDSSMTFMLPSSDLGMQGKRRRALFEEEENEGNNNNSNNHSSCFMLSTLAKAASWLEQQAPFYLPTKDIPLTSPVFAFEDEPAFIIPSTKQKQKEEEQEEEEVPTTLNDGTDTEYSFSSSSSSFTSSSSSSWFDDMQVLRDFIRFALMQMELFLHLAKEEGDSSTPTSTSSKLPHRISHKVFDLVLWGMSSWQKMLSKFH